MIEDVVLDDLAARKLAETLLLQPLGTLGVLLLSKEEGLVQEVKPYLDQLIIRNFRVSQKLYKRVLWFADEL